MLLIVPLLVVAAASAAYVCRDRITALLAKAGIKIPSV
jgi:hypothetical protein